MKITQITSAITDHTSGKYETLGLDENGDLYILTKKWVDNQRPDTTDNTKTESQYKYQWVKCLIWGQSI